MIKVSIITTTLNSSKTIENTIQIVLNQTYPNIEYIIVDGGSTDGNPDIIECYRERIARIILQPDQGMYDAMNKGIRSATGDIIGILNSDDFYENKDVITQVVNALQSTKADCLWGDLLGVRKSDVSNVVRVWQSSPYKHGRFSKGWHPPHPTLLCSKKTIKNMVFIEPICLRPPTMK